jgi:hypothetical protein
MPLHNPANKRLMRGLRRCATHGGTTLGEPSRVGGMPHQHQGGHGHIWPVRHPTLHGDVKTSAWQSLPAALSSPPTPVVEKCNGAIAQDLLVNRAAVVMGSYHDFMAANVLTLHVDSDVHQFFHWTPGYPKDKPPIFLSW